MTILTRLAIAALTCTTMTAGPVSAEDWEGFYAGIFGGTTRLSGQHPRWPGVPLMGVVDGTIPLFSPSGSMPGLTWQSFSAPSGNLAEFGGHVGYLSSIGDGGLLLGGELGASFAPGTDNDWGATYSVSAEANNTYTYGRYDSWFTGGPSIEMMLRGGWIVHEDVAVFLTAGVAVDQRGLAIEYMRSGPVTPSSTPSSPVAIPGPQAALSIEQGPSIHITPVLGFDAEFAIAEGWRVRTSYQSRWTSPQTVTLNVNRSTTDPLALPVVSDTVEMKVNGYTTHIVRLGLIRAFSP